MTKVTDWDAWTHLALGREMVRRGSLPTFEPFLFPSAALPYHNTEWLFDIVAYLTYVVGGYTGVILLKAALASLVAVILWKDSAPAGAPPPRPGLDVTMRAAVLFPILLLIAHRFVERPDLALMVFLTFTIYALNLYVAAGRRLLYTLPVIQVLWANTHPSVVLAFVPFLAVLAEGLAFRGLARWTGTSTPGTPSPRQLKTIAIVFGGVVLASFVNPHGPDVLTLPFRLAGSPWFVHNIRELEAPPVLLVPAPFIIAGLVALTTLARARRMPLFEVLLVLPFVGLGFSALRFVFLPMIVAGPILARNLSAMAAIPGRKWAERVYRSCAVGAAVICVVLIALKVARVEPVTDPTKVPGLGVSDAFLPERALGYLQQAGIEGRVFNTFHWGGYIAWRSFPRLAPIIDGRGYVPPGLLEEIVFATGRPELLERLHAAYGFDVVLVAYPGMPTDAREAPTTAISPSWALVYWDDVAFVYLRRTDRQASIIARDEYRYVNPANGVPHVRRALAEATRFEAITAELRRNVTATGSSIGHTLLGFAHLQAREYDQAIAAFRRAQGYGSVWHAVQGLALAYWHQGDITRAIQYYKGLASMTGNASFLYNAGHGLAQTGNHREAVQYLERARAKDPQFLPIYPALIEAYRRLGLPDQEREVNAAHSMAMRAAQATEHLRQAEGLRHARNFEAAVTDIQAALRLHPGHPLALSLLGEVYLQQGRLDDAITQQQAALGIHPQFARAHYALGTAYQRRGNHGAARRHLEEYVRLEPAGYQAWQARQALSQLP